MQISVCSASFLAVSALAGQAFAQGVAPKPLNWTGYYIGVAAGVSRLDTDWTNVDWSFGPEKRGGQANGFSFGGYTGYGALLNDVFYAGVELDVTSQSGSDHIDFTGNSAYVSLKPGVEVTARARVGYVYDRLLVFGTAGFATANHKAQWHDSSPFTWVDDNWKAGFVYGIGAEYALTPNVLLRVEALKTDFAKEITKDVNNTGCRMDNDMANFTIRSGIAYKF